MSDMLSASIRDPIPANDPSVAWIRISKQFSLTGIKGVKKLKSAQSGQEMNRVFIMGICADA